MTVIDAKYVQLLGPAISFGGKPALLELTDDDRVILSTVDKKALMRLATIFDSHARDLRVRGSESVLTIKADGVWRRLDFAPKAWGLAAFGLVGAIVHTSIANEEGIVDWANRLKAAGADEKFTKGGGSVKRVLIIAGILTAALVVFLVITSLLLGH